MTEASVQFFDPVWQGPYFGLSDRVFFVVFDRNVNGHTTVSQTWIFFTPFLTWDVSDHTTDPVCETGIWSLTSQSEISLKKKLVWQTVVWPLTLKKTQSARPWYGLWHSDAKYDWKKDPGLTDSGVAIDVTKTQSVRPRCGQRNC